ncbi:MAG: hypothetical protein U9R25_05270 [Chloroflexota bacterium]|nr:hypothetical protein [Chloroflexota bacterium]
MLRYAIILGVTHLQAIVVEGRGAGVVAASTADGEPVIAGRADGYAVIPRLVDAQAIVVGEPDIQSVGICAGYEYAIIAGVLYPYTGIFCPADLQPIVLKRWGGGRFAACGADEKAVVARRVHMHVIVIDRVYSQAISLGGCVAQHRWCLIGSGRAVEVALDSQADTRMAPGLVQVLVVVIAGPGACLVPVAGGEQDVADVDAAVVVDVAGGVVGLAGQAGTSGWGRHR